MRLDKYLKVSRIIKRRTLAKQVCDGGRVTINGRPAKAGTELTPGDRVAVNFPHKTLTIEVLLLKDNVRATEAGELYRLISEELHPASEDAMF
ncbi:MAG: RNA-binding S4 domain-containing protein [Heliobacteriaceae bacterium]|nr:RNA-binding S4 domain-containing protein [Heliobacteriaceae bacterium]MDD4587651.1 RNA-binding S4 domain-containing protein [Heliobacteriaceae bacterium]